MSGPTIIEQPQAAMVEAARAKYWRKNVVKLSRRELGLRIGYSVQSIALFERGYGTDGKPLGPRSWNRYRLVCAGFGIDFNWGVAGNGEGIAGEGSQGDGRVQAGTTA